MTDVITEYRRWKQQSEELRAKAMEARYRDLLSEAVAIAEEYRADFGAALKPPPVVTTFRFKAGGRKAKKAKPAANPAAPKPKAQPPAAKPSPKEARLQKRPETARKKLEAAKAAGAPTKNLEDKIYEIEDDLRLSRVQ